MAETIKIAKALIKFRENLKQPKKDANNPFFKSKYVPLENVVEVIDTALKGTGLTYIQVPVSSENKVGVKTTLMAEDEVLETEPFYLPAQKLDPQGYGSAMTYVRRYALSAVFGVTSDEDDDGNSASQQRKTSASRKPQAKQQIARSSEAHDNFKVVYTALIEAKGKDAAAAIYEGIKKQVKLADKQQPTDPQINKMTLLLNDALKGQTAND